MGIYASFERPDGSTYEVDLEPTWRLHLADGRIINAEDLMPDDRLSPRDDDGTVDVCMSVMGEG